MGEKKYFWLRLKRDFFKRHDIRIIEAMPNGKEIVLFYIKLLTESIDHEGMLRFSDKIPYTPEMLSTITNTDVEIVKNAIDVLKNLEMVNVLDDQTLVVNGIQSMIGMAEQDEHTRESTRQRVKAYRDKKKQCNTKETLQKRYSNVTCNGELEKEKELKKEKKNKYGVSENVLLTEKQHQKIVDAGLTDLIDELSLYIGSKGDKYKSHYDTILNWARRREKENKGNGKTYQFQQMQKTDYDMDALERRLVKN